MGAEGEAVGAAEEEVAAEEAAEQAGARTEAKTTEVEEGSWRKVGEQVG